MDPINYTQQQLNPGQVLAPWVGMAAQAQNQRLQEQQFEAQQTALQQAQELARQQAAQKLAQQEAIKKAATNVFTPGKWNPEDQATLVSQLDPASLKAMNDRMDAMGKAAQQDTMATTGGLFAALQSGDVDSFNTLADSRIAALQNSSDPNAKAQLDGLTMIKKLAAQNPGMAAGTMATQMYALPGGKDWLDSWYKQNSLPSENALREAQAAKAWADAFQAQHTTGSPEADKIINMATDNVSSSLLLANQALNLANAFDKARPAGGWVGNALEQFKKAIGGQDVYTSLKQEYVKLRNTDVLKNLPPGVASDKDIEIALKAFPDDNANPDQISGFLKGVAKLQTYSAEVNKAKAEWVAQNGNLGPARLEFSIGKEPVKKGTSFWDFTSAIAIPNVAPSSIASTAPATGSFGAGGTAPTASTAPAASTTPTKTVKGNF